LLCKVFWKRVLVFAILSLTSLILSSFFVSTLVLGFKGALLLTTPLEFAKTGLLSVFFSVTTDPDKGVFLFFTPVLLINFGLLTPL